jgi:hypothetical protein
VQKEDEPSGFGLSKMERRKDSAIHWNSPLLDITQPEAVIGRQPSRHEEQGLLLEIEEAQDGQVDDAGNGKEDQGGFQATSPMALGVPLRCHW